MSDRLRAAESLLVTIEIARQRLAAMTWRHVPFERAVAIELRAGQAVHLGYARDQVRRQLDERVGDVVASLHRPAGPTEPPPGPVEFEVEESDEIELPVEESAETEESPQAADAALAPEVEPEAGREPRAEEADARLEAAAAAALAAVAAATAWAVSNELADDAPLGSYDEAPFSSEEAEAADAEPTDPGRVSPPSVHIPPPSGQQLVQELPTASVEPVSEEIEPESLPEAPGAEASMADDEPSGDEESDGDEPSSVDDIFLDAQSLFDSPAYQAFDSRDTSVDQQPLLPPIADTGPQAGDTAAPLAGGWHDEPLASDDHSWPPADDTGHGDAWPQSERSSPGDGDGAWPPQDAPAASSGGFEDHHDDWPPLHDVEHPFAGDDVDEESTVLQRPPIRSQMPELEVPPKRSWEERVSPAPEGGHEPIEADHDDDDLDEGTALMSAPLSVRVSRPGEAPAPTGALFDQAPSYDDDDPVTAPDGEEGRAADRWPDLDELPSLGVPRVVDQVIPCDEPTEVRGAAAIQILGVGKARTLTPTIELGGDDDSYDMDDDPHTGPVGNQLSLTFKEPDEIEDSSQIPRLTEVMQPPPTPGLASLRDGEDGYAPAVEDDDYDADQVDRFIEMARTAETRGDLPQAIVYYGDLLGLAPHHLEAHLGRGRCLMELGDYSAAMSDFQRAEDLSFNSPEPIVEMGNLYFARKEYRRAIDHYDHAIGLQPTHAMAWCRRGICHFYRKNHREAFDDLQKAYALDPEIPNLRKYVQMAVKAMGST